MSTIYKHTKVTEVKKVKTATRCDFCGKEHIGDTEPKGWHQLMRRHDDWGNDSIDSNEHFDVCSPECYIQVIRASLAQMRSHKETAEIDGMNYEFADLFVSYIHSQKLTK